MWLSLGLLILGLAGLVQSDIYKKGDTAVLSPGPVSGPITSVTWKHGVDMAVEWYGEELEEYRDFKGRCEVNNATGELTISNLSLKDSGSYTAEINNKIMKTTEIKVITAVPKPTISTHCNPEETQCTLTCNANIPKTAGSVTYSWMIGDVVKPPATTQLDITKNDTESLGKPISCQLENPVSRERSDDIMNPFTNGTSVVVIAAAVVIALIVLVALIALADYLIWRNSRTDCENAGCRQYVAWFMTRRCPNCVRTAGTAGGEATLAQEQRNGAGAPQGTREEMTPLVPVQNGGAPDLSVQETSCSSVVPTFYSPSTATFSVDNETHNQDQNPGSPEARNETPETLSGVPETAAQDLTPVELPETTSDPEKPKVDAEDKETSDPKKENCSETKGPKTTSEVQEELEGEQTPPGSADTSSRSGDLTEKSAVKEESEQQEEEEATQDQS